MRASRRSGVLLVLVVVVALLGPAFVAGPAQAATGRVRGTIAGVKGDPSPRARVTWFTQDWTYLGSRQGARGWLLAGPRARHLPPAVQ